MTVKAKFFVQTVTLHAANSGGEVTLRAACRGAVNADWAAATPAGEIRMTINNPSAFEYFRDRLGREFSILFDEWEADPTTHAFVPHPRRDQREAWGWDLCHECGGKEDEHPSAP